MSRFATNIMSVKKDNKSTARLKEKIIGIRKLRLARKYIQNEQYSCKQKGKATFLKP